MCCVVGEEIADPGTLEMFGDACDIVMDWSKGVDIIIEGPRERSVLVESWMSEFP